MKRKGFSLIECMIYCILTIFLLYLVVPWSIRVLSLNAIIFKNIQLFVDTSITRDLFVKDIFDSSNHKDNWIIVSEKCLLWRNQRNSYIEWSCKNNALYRSVGIYNEKEKKWNKKHTDLVLKDVKEAYFTIDQTPSQIQLITLQSIINKHRYFFTASSRYEE